MNYKKYEFFNYRFTEIETITISPIEFQYNFGDVAGIEPIITLKVTFLQRTATNHENIYYSLHGKKCTYFCVVILHFASEKHKNNRGCNSQYLWCKSHRSYGKLSLNNY